MNRVADCVRDVIEIVSGGDEATATKHARARIDAFYTQLATFLMDKPQRDGSSEVSELVDQLRVASAKAVKQNAHALADNIDRCIDYVRAARRC